MVAWRGSTYSRQRDPHKALLRPDIQVARSTQPSWLPICLEGCTKRFHVDGIPLRMPHRPHALSKLLDKCGIRCRIRQPWHDVTERRQDEAVSRRRKDCFGEVFDSEVLLQPRVYGRKIVMRHRHQRPENDRSIRSNEIGSRTDNKFESWQLRRAYVSHRHPEFLHHYGNHDRAVKKKPKLRVSVSSSASPTTVSLSGLIASNDFFR